MCSVPTVESQQKKKMCPSQERNCVVIHQTQNHLYSVPAPHCKFHITEQGCAVPTVDFVTS